MLLEDTADEFTFLDCLINLIGFLEGKQVIDEAFDHEMLGAKADSTNNCVIVCRISSHIICDNNTH